MSVEFIGTCVGLKAEDLHDFDDSSRGITNRTFRKFLGKEEYREFELSLGYRDGSGLVLSKDWHVSYAKGKWKGRPAICCWWSGIHHIWVINKKEAAV